MAEKKNEEEKKEKEKEPKEAADHDDGGKAGGRRKLKLMIAVALVLLVALGLGGFFGMKALKSRSLQDAPAEHASEGEAKDGTHGEAKDDAHAAADTKADAKTDAKSDAPAKSDAKADAHGGEKDKAEAPKTDGGKPDEGKAEAAKDGEKKEGEKKDGEGNLLGLLETPKFGETFTLPKMDLNLGNPLENRYLTIRIAVEFRGGEEQKKEIEKREPQLKDIVINTVNSRTRMELLSPDGKNRLRREILNRFNEVLERPVEAIYLTDFLVE